MPLIEVKNATKTYPDGTKALRDVSLTINTGEFLGIMGPSGSGKSTLLHILGSLDTQTTGTYRFDGKEMSSYSEDEIAQIRNKKMGFIFQMFNLLPRATVLENVMLPLVYAGIKEPLRTKRALEAIESVGLAHRKDHDSLLLSGGEKQRVAIARAIANDPDVIFADEPTGNLDSASGKVVMDILKKINEEKENRTVILITHEENTARYTDRVIQIVDGAIKSDVANGKVKDKSL
jgi:putative ABC transport system ATP-binding protein